MNIRTALFALALPTILISCSEDDKQDTIPTPAQKYSFTRDGVNTISFSGQTARLNMLAELSTYGKSAASGITLDGDLMLDMFNNTNSPFQDASLNESGKDLASKTFELDVDQFIQYIQDLAALSAFSQDTASNGKAGIVYSNDGAKSYLVNENGMELAQVIEKGLMGATFYYQATSVYLSDEKIGEGIDNTSPVDPENGKFYTTMEHHWDEAFGYFGVPTDFPENTEGLMFHGKYSNGRDAVLGSNKLLMDAFIKGRLAIVNKDATAKTEAIAEVRENWEKLIASCAIHYLNGAVSDFSDNALRSHQLSECFGFIMSLKYNAAKSVSNADLDGFLASLGTNYYESTVNGLTQLRDELATAFGLENQKTQL